ncbi:acetylornithine transaminase [Actinomyces culturomici]|uniref:acetylornithine transaminase n=1 Tax=Actinomyces culturomici TaxID=1926276 RepID=UPI000E20B052|nr:acetylornithine transaminase [Actinomyces culturomici]
MSVENSATASQAEWADRYAGTVMNTFGAPALVLVEGEGTRVTDADGNTYLDLLGGIAVNVLGQCHPKVVEAITTQARTLGHVSNYFGTPPQIGLAEKLLSIVEPGGAPEGSRVFLANSGTEANECALKLVKAHGVAISESKTRIIALDHAFHGRTIGALSLTWKEKYRLPFAPLVPGVEFVPANDVAALEAAMDEDVAGVFVEPIQGEAGVHPLSAEYLEAVRALTRAHGALMVVDEVQTGIGRTGDWMGHHASGVLPDVVTLAKGLGGGMPIGACVALGSAATVLGPGMHGTTFGGNPICAAAALAVLGEIEEAGLLARVSAISEHWRAELARVPGVAEVRGRGYLIGVDFDAEIAEKVVAAGRAAGFILNATGPATLRLAPPLVLSQAEADSFTAALPGLLAAARNGGTA